MKRTILSIALIAAGATAANAWGTSSRDIDRTEANQASRIRDGVISGSLTRAETRNLVGEQRRIEQMETAARRDGVVTRAERDAIRRAQADASRDIYREKHDGERRWWRWW